MFLRAGSANRNEHDAQNQAFQAQQPDSHSRQRVATILCPLSCRTGRGSAYCVPWASLITDGGQRKPPPAIAVPGLAPRRRLSAPFAAWGSRHTFCDVDGFSRNSRRRQYDLSREEQTESVDTEDRAPSESLRRLAKCPLASRRTRLPVVPGSVSKHARLSFPRIVCGVRYIKNGISLVSLLFFLLS